MHIIMYVYNIILIWHCIIYYASLHECNVDIQTCNQIQIKYTADCTPGMLTYSMLGIGAACVLCMEN